MIWLIGGTSESVIVAELILQHNLPVIISITTEKARQLYSAFAHDSNCYVFVGKLSSL